MATVKSKPQDNSALVRLAQVEATERDHHAALSEQVDHLHYASGAEMSRAARLLNDAPDGDATAGLQDMYGAAGSSRALASSVAGILAQTGEEIRE